MKFVVFVVSNVVCVLFCVLGDICVVIVVEYGIIIGFVVILMIVGLSEFVKSMMGMWNNVNIKVEVVY